MKIGDLCRVGGGGFARDPNEEDGYRVATTSGIAIYLGEEKFHPDNTKNSGKYYVFFELFEGRKRAPFIWYHFSGKDVDSKVAYDQAVEALQRYGESEDGWICDGCGENYSCKESPTIIKTGTLSGVAMCKECYFDNHKEEVVNEMESEE